MLTGAMKVAAIGFAVAGFVAATAPHVAAAAEHGVFVTVKGESWDADSRGFAYFGARSKQERDVTSAGRGSRISLDGHPETFVFAAPGPGFELSFTTAELSFQLIVEGDRFPRFISQRFKVPKGGGKIDVGCLSSIRANGAEHTWPLALAASRLGYRSSYAMLADNNVAVRILVLSSGADGTPPLANDTTLSVQNANAAVIPFTMDKQDTYFQITGPRLGAFLVIVPFAKGDAADKDLIIKVTDTVSEPGWSPPRPWPYGPVKVIVRNGFASDILVKMKID